MKVCSLTTEQRERGGLSVRACRRPCWGRRRLSASGPSTSPATEWRRVTSRDSSSVISGMIVGSLRASIVLPDPGGPVKGRWTRYTGKGTRVRLVSYIRISTDRQVEEGLGLHVQKRSIRAWAKTNGHRLVEITRDEGVSGANGIEGRIGLPGRAQPSSPSATVRRWSGAG
jgi:hypothetical protein